MGARRQRRERFLSMIMKVLDDGEPHSIFDMAEETKLTTREVCGLIRGSDIEREKLAGVTFYRKPIDASIGGENCQAIGSMAESE